MTVRHGVMHYRITMTCLEAEHTGGKFASPFYVAARWLRPEQLADYPVSSPQRKLMTLLASPNRQPRLF